MVPFVGGGHRLWSNVSRIGGQSRSECAILKAAATAVNSDVVLRDPRRHQSNAIRNSLPFRSTAMSQQPAGQTQAGHRLTNRPRVDLVKRGAADPSRVHIGPDSVIAFGVPDCNSHGPTINTRLLFAKPVSSFITKQLELHFVSSNRFCYP